MHPPHDIYPLPLRKEYMKRIALMGRGERTLAIADHHVENRIQPPALLLALCRGYGTPEEKIVR